MSRFGESILGNRFPQAVAHAAAGAAELQDEALLFKRAQITFCRGVGHLAEFLYLVVGDVAVLTQVSDDFIEVCLTFTAAGGYSAGGERFKFVAEHLLLLLFGELPDALNYFFTCHPEPFSFVQGKLRREPALSLSKGIPPLGSG